MKPTSRRTKGSAFERLVAGKIAKMLGVGTKQCYRTPLSGGHPYGDVGDITMSEELRQRFPFMVECKHNRGWNLTHLLDVTALVRGWIDKAEVQASKVELYPLLVVRGNNTPIVAFSPVPVSADARVRIRRGDQPDWYGCLFDVWLAAVSKAASVGSRGEAPGKASRGR